MNKRIERCTMAAAMALGSMAFAGILSTAQAGLPPVQQQGSVQYVSGGIGLDESEAMKAAEKDYPLALTFAAQRGGKADYVANVAVVISDAHGKSVLQATAEGPYMLVKLPAGKYKVSATYDGKVQEREVSVTHPGTARAVFEWK
ncbi:carboxypeptidase-like regulatory domain-containing protein [Achromobacter aegrifaciens]